MAEADKKDQKGNEAVATAPSDTSPVDTTTAPDDVSQDTAFEGLTNDNTGPAATAPQNAPANDSAEETAPEAPATTTATSQPAAPQNDATAEEETPAPPRRTPAPAATEEEEAPEGGKKSKSKFLNDDYQQMVYRKIWKVDEIDAEAAKIIDSLKYDNKKGLLTFETPAGSVNWGVDSRGKEFIGRRGLFGAMTQELAEAELTLAKARGWESITLHGRESTKEMLWLSAQRRGIEVTNFVPSPDSEVYKIWKKESQELSGVMNAKDDAAPKNDAAPAQDTPAAPAETPAAEAPAAPEEAAPAAAEADAPASETPAAEAPAAPEEATPATAEATAEEPAAPVAAEAQAPAVEAPATEAPAAPEADAPAAEAPAAPEEAAPATVEATAEEPAAPVAAEAQAPAVEAPATEAPAAPEAPAAEQPATPVASKFGTVEPPKPADDPYSKEALAARGMVNPLPAGDVKYEAWEKKKESINRADYSGWQDDYRDVAAVESLSKSAAEAKSPAHAEGITKLQDAIKSGKVEIKDSFDRLALSKIESPAGFQQAADYFQKKAGGIDLGLPKVEDTTAPAASAPRTTGIKNKGP